MLGGLNSDKKGMYAYKGHKGFFNENEGLGIIWKGSLKNTCLKEIECITREEFEAQLVRFVTYGT